ncbi:endoplasmic reticulum aminopeptidase 1 [Hyalella azteca]|uniref:Endoplasmic reticulum aminopeptidase 1 n=1 Tax=Hyalella azteca TaxID=294128 RepID=A0A979FU09_HYAAZ|nr:endoplasmic reticulum aminopeptidase 1 [Hyalella azteca]
MRRSSSGGGPRGGFSRDPTMSDHDVDDIAFLTGSGQDSGFLMSKRALYEPGSVLVCSQKRACLVVALCFLSILLSAAIVAFTKPGCPVATYIGEPLDDENAFVTKKKSPILSTSGEVFPWSNIRLPVHIRPLHYSLHLHPNLTTRHMDGQVTIKFTTREETNFIIVHSRNINITNYSLHDKYLQRNTITKFLEYPKNEQLYLGVRNTLRRGSNYTLFLEYNIALNEGLDGVYLSSYTIDAQKRYLAATHFEPTSARAAFPCFDEPHLKARFELSIVRERSYFALFNMPLRASSPVQGSSLMRDEFDVSVEMSTYLVCFVVCDFAKVSNKTNNNVTVSVYAPANIIHQADYALHASITLLEYYHEFFTVPYPLPKLDLIAIPDFGAGAMENWGLVTYKETALMFVEGVSSARAQQRIAVVLAHELAHQWFGNLVTMEWWQDLWLNEGFASFMEVLGTSEVEPHWSMLDQFVVETVQPALALDGLLSSHPVSTPVEDPANIEAIFDAISYKKGASLIYMLEMFLGRSTSVSGLRAYLDEHRFSSANTADFWRSMAAVSQKPGLPDVQVVMDTWTRQVGYPVVTVVVEDGRVFASQKRFLVTENLLQDSDTNSTDDAFDDSVSDHYLTGVKQKEDEAAHQTDLTADPISPINSTIGFKWHVPLTYVTSEDPDNSTLVWMNLTNVEFEVSNDLAWVKFNVGQRGFYRVNYDPATWRALILQLKNDHRRLSSADRASLIDDVFSLASASEVNVSMAFELSEYLVGEEQYGPWHTALTHLFDWARMLFTNSYHKHLLAHICSIISNQYEAIGWDDSGTHLKKLLRSEMLQAALDCAMPEAIAEARQRFQLWRMQDVAVPPNLRSVIYQAGVRHGGDEAWWWCWARYRNSTLASERRLLLEALAQTSSAWLLEQFLQYTLDETMIRSQDVHFVIDEVSRNPNGRLAAWRSVRQNWADIMRRHGHSSYTISAIIKAVTVHHTTLFDLHEVEDFFADVAVGGGERALQASLENIRQTVYWLQMNSDDIADYLNEHYPHISA